MANEPELNIRKRRLEGMRLMEGFPALRALGGALLVLAGVVAFFGVSFGVAAVLIIVAGGGAVLALAVLGHRFRSSDYAVFLVGVIVLGAVAVGPPAGSETVTYSATRAQVPESAVSLTVSADVGSVFVGFSNDPGLAYQVNFTRNSWISTLGSPGADVVENSTGNGVFSLSVGSTWSSVSVLIGSGYALGVSASTGTGSIHFDADGSESLGNVTLKTSTGSTNVALHSATIQSLSVTTGTGSVAITSSALKAAGPSTPISVATSTGSVNVNAGLAGDDAVALVASTSLGSISHTLSGFDVTEDTSTSLRATAGDPLTAPLSFEMTVTANLGSVNLNVGFV